MWVQTLQLTWANNWKVQIMKNFSYEHVSLISSNTGSEDSDHVGSNDEELSDEQ